MLAHGADSKWTCFDRGSLRPIYVNHQPDRLKPTRLRLCMMMSFRECSITSSRLALSSVVRDHRSRGLTPTDGLQALHSPPGAGFSCSFSSRRHCIWQSRCCLGVCRCRYQGNVVTANFATRRASFWSDKLTSAKSPRDMWSTVDRLLGYGHRACDAFSADDLSSFFAKKVDRIRSTTSGSAPPTIRPAPPGIAFTEFASLSSDNVAAAIARLPDKSSAADPFLVSVLKGVSDVLTPFLTYLFNRSLPTGCVPASFKDSFVTPILKKSGLDEASPSSYRRYRTCQSFPRRWNAWLRVNL